MTAIEQLQKYCPITGWLLHQRKYKKKEYKKDWYKEYYQKNKEAIKIKRMQNKRSNYYL